MGVFKNAIAGYLISKTAIVSFSPDGQILVSLTYSRSLIYLWDIATRELKHIFRSDNRPHSAFRGPIHSVSFSPDGQTLASAHWEGVGRLWDVDTGELKHTFRGHTDVVYSVAFSPDGQTLASGSGDSTMLLWDIEPAEPESQESPDVNGDGIVNIQDLVRVASRLGQPVPAGGDPADVNGDGVINIQDLVQVAGAIGN